MLLFSLTTTVVCFKLNNKNNLTYKKFKALQLYAVTKNKYINSFAMFI